MATDYIKTAPANSGSGILTENKKVRDNWTALDDTIGVDHNSMGEDEDGQHAKVTLLVRDKPTAIPSTGIVYAKDDVGTSKAELWFLDEDDDEVQLTKDGDINIGALADNAPPGVAVAWGVFSTNGTMIEGYNLATATKTSGTWTIPFDGIKMTTATYCVIPSSNGTTLAYVDGKSTASFVIKTKDVQSVSVVVFGTAEAP